MKNGQCKDQTKCAEFHHPKLCPSVKKQVECNREKCHQPHSHKKKRNLNTELLNEKTNTEEDKLKTLESNLMNKINSRLNSIPNTTTNTREPETSNTGFQGFRQPQTPPPDQQTSLYNMIQSLALEQKSLAKNLENLTLNYNNLDTKLQPRF